MKKLVNGKVVALHPEEEQEILKERENNNKEQKELVEKFKSKRQEALKVMNEIGLSVEHLHAMGLM